jgi:hypothetical protein
MIQNIDPKIVIIAGSTLLAGIFLFVVYMNLTNNKRILRFINDIHDSFIQDGISTSLIVDRNYYLDKIGKTLKETSDFIEGVFLIKDEKFDYIFYRSGGSSNYYDYLEYIVTDDTFEGKTSKSNRANSIFYQRGTRLSVRRNSWLFGKVTRIYWKGDENLSRMLNSDNLLNERLVQRLQGKRLLGQIFIYWKNRYAVIRIPVYTSSSEDFAIMNMISRHIKSVWFGS